MSTTLSAAKSAIVLVAVTMGLITTDAGRVVAQWIDGDVLTEGSAVAASIGSEGDCTVTQVVRPRERIRVILPAMHGEPAIEVSKVTCGAATVAAVDAGRIEAAALVKSDRAGR
ncbi:MAG TPA: hypothetical protein VMP03_05215 [Methylomirabilota bacterium]|nr:hypothetical protein [Methylomirabilota bacterium]